LHVRTGEPHDRLSAATDTIMPDDIKQMSAEQLAAYLCAAQTNAEAYTIYGLCRDKLAGWRFVLASDRGPTRGFAVNRVFAHGAAIRSPFSTDRVIVLDETTYHEMQSGTALIGIDFSISLDTQAISYIQPFLEGKLGRLPKDFLEVVMFLARPEVNCDPMPYMLENYRNLSDPKNYEAIFRKVRGYEVLRSLDASHLNEKGEIRSRLSEAELNKKAQETLGDWLFTEKGFIDALEQRHRTVYCLILKMAEIQLGNRGMNQSEKTIKMLQFMDFDMATMFIPEALLANGNCSSPV
jgi:hypothetical protein